VALLGLPHFFGVVVIVGECLVDLRNIQMVSLGHPFGGEPTFFETCVYISDGDTTSFDVGLAVNFRLLGRDDSILLGRD